MTDLPLPDWILRQLDHPVVSDRTPEEWREIHKQDCLDVIGKPVCGYECPTCGLCTKWSHGGHKAPMCLCKVVIKMPHVPMQTAKMIVDKLGIVPRRRSIIASHQGARGFPPGEIHVIEARDMMTTQRDSDMYDTLEPYESDDRYTVIWHDCDTVMGVKR